MGKAPECFLLSYEACKLSSRYSFGGGAWDRPVTLAHRLSRVARHRSVWTFISSNAQIEISINWCMERGHMNLHRHHCRFLQFWFFFLWSWCKVKLKRTLLTVEGDSPPHERVSRTDLGIQPSHDLIYITVFTIWLNLKVLGLLACSWLCIALQTCAIKLKACPRTRTNVGAAASPCSPNLEAWRIEPWHKESQTLSLSQKLAYMIGFMERVPYVGHSSISVYFCIPLQGNSVKSDVHFGHFEGLDFYCQWGQLGFKVCMMCMGTSTIITLIIRLTPCFILEKCVKNTMVLDVRARNDFFTLSCSCSKLCDVWGLTLKLIPVLITWSIGLYNIHKHYL